MTEHTGTELIAVDAGGWGLTWAADLAGTLRQIGLGPAGHRASLDVDAVWYPEAYPTWGGGDPLRAAPLRITHANGLTTTRLVVDRVTRTSLDDGEHVVVACRDSLVDLTVEHHLRTHPTSAVLEQWIEIYHQQAEAILVADYDSVGHQFMVDPTTEICHFGGGGWATEWAWNTDRLGVGTTTLDSFGGVQPHLQRNPLLLVSPNGPSTEVTNDVVAMSIAWGGNTRFALDVRRTWDTAAPLNLRLRAGANPVGAEYRLDPNERFVTPTVAWTWAADGRQPTTDRFHRWTRDRVLRDPDRLRPLVVNNWEAVFFDFDHDRLVGLMDRTADLGADLFLLDDGWFGNEHPRNDDDAGLGDWEVNISKLPEGLDGLAAAAAERNIRFGIWLEPEMVNPASDLYETHPDWIVSTDREPLQHRQQYYLDPLRPEVRDFEFGVFERTLTPTPGISYVKWDANRPITDPGSEMLPNDRQSNLWVDHVWATWAVMSDVAAAHPEVELMLCASGGGRIDHGSLRWFHEFWTSDNTDPVARVRMQWACSMFFPSSAMAAHVTRWADRPLDFACAVALSARFGFDLDLNSLSPEEMTICRNAVAVARRTQPLVQHGRLQRLVSPVEGTDTSRAGLAYVDAEQSSAVVFAYQLEEPTSEAPRLLIDGLENGRSYSVTRASFESDPTAELVEPLLMTGAAIGDGSIPWEPTKPLTAAIWEITAAD